MLRGFAALLLATMAAAGTPATAGPPPAPSPVVSPTKVLAEIAAHPGHPSLSREGSGAGPDRSLAPYFAVAGAPDTERLPLKETSADVAIAGVIARVKVHQLFENSGKKPIEAIYVFPASTRAAVHGMRMKIGERVIEAKIDRRAAARERYETARQEGKRASLLEQERPNVFTMNVANVMPGDRIAVELDYSELLVPEDATYEFVYPTVVGPRYGGGASPTKDKWIANPYLRAGEKEPYRFDIKVHVETGIALKELASPSHEVDVTYAGPNRADVRLKAAGGGNRDFVLRYRLSDDKIETGALLWQGEGQGEGFFAVMMEPPRRPRSAQIPPREYVFLLDVSGSMHGFPLETAKALMRKLLGNLRPVDQFNVVLFSGAFQVLSADGSLPAQPDNVARALSIIERQSGGGGTELMGGLEASYRIPRRDQNVSRTVVVVTDGFVGVEAQAFRFIRDRLGEANLFAFGIGSSVNRGLIEGMARAGQGEPFVVLQPDKAQEQAEKLRATIEQPVLSHVSVSFNGFDATEIAPAHLPDLMARRPLLLYGKFRGAPSGRIDISGFTGTGRFHQSVQVRPEDVRPENAALRSLWARKWVEVLDDERHMGGGPATEEAITGLGLGYSLLTSFTSFVAVDSQVVNAGGDAARVRQPLPLPEGVSDLAVGGTAGHGAMGMMMKRKSLAPMDEAQGLGGLGSGAGVGRAMAPRPVAAPTPSRAMPPPPPSLAPPLPATESAARAAGPSKRPPAAKSPVADGEKDADREDRRDDKNDKKEKKADAPAPRALGIVALTPAGLSDVAPLRSKLEALLASLAVRCAVAPGTKVELRLTVDGAGKVTRVALVAGDRRLLGCLEGPLGALASETHAVAATPGTVTLTLQAR